jgi:hypothetical protein
MKKAAILFILFLSFRESFAQSVEKSNPLLNLSLGFGILPISDAYLRETYNVRNAFNWDLGLAFGSQTSDFQFFVKFNRFGLTSTIDSSVNDTVSTSNTSRIDEEEIVAGRNQLAAGIRRFEKASEKSYVTFSSALILFNMVKEDLRDINNVSPGLLIGTGYQYRSNDGFNYFIRLSYEYNVFVDSDIRYDWSAFNLLTGISFNLSSLGYDSGKAKEEDFINP